MGRKKGRRKSEPCPAPNDEATCGNSGNQSEPEWVTGKLLPTTPKGRKPGRKGTRESTINGCHNGLLSNDSSQAQQDMTSDQQDMTSDQQNKTSDQQDKKSDPQDKTSDPHDKTSDPHSPRRSGRKRTPSSKLYSPPRTKKSKAKPNYEKMPKALPEKSTIPKVGSKTPSDLQEKSKIPKVESTTDVSETLQIDGKKTKTVKPRKTGQRRKKGAGKKKMGRVIRSLPSFDDDDDDVFEPINPLRTEQDSTQVQGPSLPVSSSQTSNSSSAILSQSVSDMYDDMNGVMDQSYDDIDLESNQSSDDDLPDVLSQETTKVNEGDIVWARFRKFPFWPAVVKKLYRSRGKAAVFFAGELNKSNQKGKGVSLRLLKPYSCPEKDFYIDAGLKHPKVSKEEFQEAVDLAENYITKRGLGKAQGASFFTIKDYSETTPTKSTPLSLTCTPSMKAGLPLNDTPSSPLTPPCDTPDDMPRSILDSPIWKSGRALSEGRDQSMEDDEDSSDVDEETMEKRYNLTKLQDRLLRYITRSAKVKEHLVKILHRKVKSIRHELYFTSGSDAQNKLKYMRGFGPITDDDKQDEIIKFLRKVYEVNCPQDDDHNDVVMTSYLIDVWFPEVIIFALQKTQRIGHKRAEQMFVTEAKNAMEITGAMDIHMPLYLTEEEKKELLDNVPRRAARQLGLDPKALGLS